ncbi:hypothetical protein DYB28_001599 [Aphanomyces astaci]|uniref:EamA domain-containing protein n=1 Tax=Aphanomyces astaci TaxID=112090 RepID=A0A397AU42_APHAT|nr:hypothetical protein DYB36_003337 [Aphanomyces astaci]RHY14154.1 hypothetical protein DYB25_001153 [Aphanomyces astaci]RHY40519.1 hypothetical protein DYB34_005482 [Aphanomyces astaci]RHY60999.1 hypothetical protein DYB38_002701 [Aphanomyces astaci]RHY66679.1 hypothetical protein DYB30_005727 [Aphanomyces astaci]
MPTPWWAYIVLALSISTMSSGGVWFALFTQTPPIMQACWRLLLTALLQSVGVVYELLSNRSLDAEFWAKYRRSLPLLMAIGAAIGCYFGTWGWSVAHTTLLDSLLLVCTTPLLLVVIMTLRWLYRRHSPSSVVISLQERTVAKETDAMIFTSTATPTLFETIVCPPVALPPTWMEAAGALVGFSGVVVLLSSTSDQSTQTHPVTLAGNIASMAGALVLIVYLEGGAACRQWMPLFIYSLSVTAFGAVCLAIASLVLEPQTSVVGLGPAALFGFFGDWQLFGLAFGAAFVAGFFGHACLNSVVVHVSPLLVSVSGLWEPLLGSYMGYLAGVQGQPDLMTLVAAPLLLGGALLVTLGGRREATTTMGALTSVSRRNSLVVHA